LNGSAAIGEAVGAVLGRWKRAEHFIRAVPGHDFAVERDPPASKLRPRIRSNNGKSGRPSGIAHRTPF
jgi:hypothetical protein